MLCLPLILAILGELHHKTKHNFFKLNDNLSLFVFFVFQNKSFKTYVKVFPFSKQTGWKPSPVVYQRTVGAIEIACALLLMFFPGEPVATIYYFYLACNNQRFLK